MTSGFPFDPKRPVDLICMGRVAVDLYAEQIYSPLSAAQSLRCYVGGCAGNIAIGLARQGLQSMMFSKIGTDDMGQFVLRTLKKEGVNTSLLSETAEAFNRSGYFGGKPA